ncbi:4-hydroxybenzoate octaprenyltransferase [Hirschia maritima]|uniref:4-hydroxybenzoate octaprenyltransferase n=1 Tax=Hirschia maritima TaxID=1121961 RepID=UPI00037231A2|nr:4-hydroxybenzoate octaprenyltransferase [Hirschia maritima]
MTPPHTAIPKDAQPKSWVDNMPNWAEPYCRLSRYDRPVGIWLLALPGWIAISFARLNQLPQWSDVLLALLILIGAIAMRGAGCTYNDILDKDFDAKVDRTAGRPIPSGRISVKNAWIWTIVQCLIGLGVLLALPHNAQVISLASIPLVAAYPLMKRITWWPQVWLGFTFNWAILVAIAAVNGHVRTPDILLYLGFVFWTIGYDTIYALQDKEDDAMIGVRSTARRFGNQVRPAIFTLYGISIALLCAACLMRQAPIGLIGIAIFSGHLFLQALRTTPNMGDSALLLFKSNREAALLLLAGFGLSSLVLV